ncbi:MAG: HIT domain-containing protein [Candidatus Aenigmatarchaeota archaeon]
MTTQECIFCKIAKKEIPSYIIYEDEKCVAFLDIRPVTKGMVILVPRFHYENFDFDIQTSFHCLKKSFELSKGIKDVLEAMDVQIAIIRSPLKHFNIRIYPIYSENDVPIFQNKPIDISESELNQIWQKMLAIKVEVKENKEEKVEKPQNQTISESKNEKSEVEKLIERWRKKFLP